MEVKQEIINALARYIKEQEKSMKEGENNRVLGIYYNNWQSGISKKWVRSEVKFDGKTYNITDKELTEGEFVHLLGEALEKSKARGKVFSQTYGDGYWISKVTRFDRLEIFGKPCKEFNDLNKLLVKLGTSKIDETSVYSVGICGKRSSYDDDGDYRYLCYNPKKCKRIIDFIKENKGRNGVVRCSIESFIDKGDEMDYEIAQYQESEWYGSRGYNLVVNIKGGKGKKDYKKEFK